MNTTTIVRPITVPSIFDRFPKVATQQRHAVRPRSYALLSTLIGAPIVAGMLGGRSAKGSVMFAGYDSPMTLPRLRRNELWIEVI